MNIKRTQTEHCWKPWCLYFGGDVTEAGAKQKQLTVTKNSIGSYLQRICDSQTTTQHCFLWHIIKLSGDVYDTGNLGEINTWCWTASS